VATDGVPPRVHAAVRGSGYRSDSWRGCLRRTKCRRAGGVGIDALADAVDVVALQQAVDALLGGVGVATVELGRELRDLELLAGEVGGDAEGQLVARGASR